MIYLEVGTYVIWAVAGLLWCLRALLRHRSKQSCGYCKHYSKSGTRTSMGFSDHTQCPDWKGR